MDKVMERLRWGQILEDCGVAVQDLYNAGKAKDAMVVRLVISHHLIDLISILMATRPIGRTDAVDVLRAADSIMRRESRMPDVEVPLVSIGQGDYRRDITEADVVKAEVARRSWADLCDRAFRRLSRVIGVAS